MQNHFSGCNIKAKMFIFSLKKTCPNCPRKKVEKLYLAEKKAVQTQYDCGKGGKKLGKSGKNPEKLGLLCKLVWTCSNGV